MDKSNIWQQLSDAIQQDKVIPIIGDEFFYAEVEGENVPYTEFLLQKLLEKFPIPQRPKDSSSIRDVSPDFNMIASNIQISNIIASQYGTLMNPTNIYYEIEEIIQNNPIKCDEQLIEFLQKTDFNILMTTSFLPGLETVMKKVNSQLIVKAYDRSPRIDYDPNSGQTLYYLFGKSIKVNKGFMVTEDDLLDYMHFWHNLETRPKKLCKLLGNKLLLVLGCDYPNWLFRFFWHSVKNFRIYPENGVVSGVVAGNLIDSEVELTRFLSRIQAHAYGSCSDVLRNILSVMPEKTIKATPDVEQETHSQDIDIFISYAHENSDVAIKIAETFENYGAKVWFDNSALVGSDKYDDIIRQQIESCKRFVPLLSTYTLNAPRGYFKKEWSMAIEESRFRYGDPYISPLLIDNSDITSPRFPREFKDAHVLNYLDANFEDSVKKFIRSFR